MPAATKNGKPPKGKPKVASSDDSGKVAVDVSDTKFKIEKAKACQALAVLEAAKLSAHETLNSELNPGSEKPKRGSFEIYVTRSDGEEILVWSGLKRGPPRKEKFPDADELLKAVLRYL